ncbi:DUF4429 domain-containing protein [Leucobacter albus]|uniref:DUF4429 domain-containing protein n=1 Tax=Leucobacter albus TaxID=272210 RepID=A0ABW3TQH4_9MICO
MTALRVEGFGGHVEFDGIVLKLGTKGLGKAANETREIRLSDVERIDFVAATRFSNGQLRFAIPGQTAKKAVLDPNSVFFTRKQAPQFEQLHQTLSQSLAERGELSSAERDAIQTAFEAQRATEYAVLEDRIEELKRKTAGVVYAGHIVDYKGYRHGLGLKRPIEGATAEFESGADRSRPTLTRIGGGALLAGPVGAIAGGMFKKDKTKGYVTIVFPDGATVIVEGPAKDEKKMREFASAVTRIGAAELKREGGSTEAAAPEATEPGVADQLLKLKQLLDAGVLTQEQYDEKTRPLIANL